MDDRHGRVHTEPAAVAVYIGSGAHSVDGSPYTYLVDDIVVTTESTEPPPPTPVVEIDFNDGTWGDWVQSGGPALSVVDDAGNGVLQVANRANDFDGIKSPAMFEAGVEYVFSMEVKLATPGTAQFRFVTDPGFTWIGNTTVNGDGWTTVSGAFTPSQAVAVYIGSGAHSVDGSPYTYLVDDIVVTTESTEPPPPPPVGIVLSTDFEDGLDGWTARSAQGQSDGGGHHRRGARWRPGGARVEPRPVRATASGTTSPGSWCPAARTRSRPG